MLDGRAFNRAREDDLKTIEEICTDTWEPLYRFIYYRVQNREEAEDITQDTFVKTISYIKKDNNNIKEYISFLKTVALNVIRDRWRKKKRRGTDINLDSINPEVISEEDSTQLSVQRELIKDALSKLKEEQYKVVELRTLKGYSVAETAKIMEKTETAIRVLQYRTLKTLSSMLKNND